MQSQIDYIKSKKHFPKQLIAQPFLKQIEIALAQHCNLNCAFCNHFSQLAKANILDLDSFKRDIVRLGELTAGQIGRIFLLGGEPLLNPHIKEMCAIARENFPKSHIWIITNGILLPKQSDEFWEVLRKNKIELHPTKYPVKLNWDEIKQKAERFGIPLIFYNEGEEIKMMAKEHIDISGAHDPIDCFLNCCKANNCVELKNGRIYPCTYAGNIEHFNAYFKDSLEFPLETCELDSIDIFKAKNYREILDFCSKPIPFCRYCAVEKWGKIAIPHTKSSKKIDEYI